jgi:hypothetical protein
MTKTDKPLSHQERLKLGVDLMRSGFTYGEAAESVGVSVKSLAWAAHNAGVRSRAPQEHRLARQSEAQLRFHRHPEMLRVREDQRAMPNRPEPSLPKLKFLEKE